MIGLRTTEIRSRSPFVGGRQRTRPICSAIENSRPKIVVVGGGWAGQTLRCALRSSQRRVSAGFGAAKHLTSEGYDVTLLDAAANPGGLSTGFRTPQGRAVEAGMKGFWYQVSCDCYGVRSTTMSCVVS